MANKNFYQDEPWLGGTSAPGTVQNNTNATGGNWWSNMSPQTQAAIIGMGGSIAGGYISGREERASQNANNDAAMDRLQLQLQMEREQREREMAQKQKELALQNMTQAPTRQDWRQHQALLSAMLPGMRNYQVQVPAELQRFAPQISGGMRIPEGGFDQSTLAFFSPEARAGAEADLDRAGAQAAGGNYATPDYARAGYGSAAGDLQKQNQSYADQIKQQALSNTGQLGSMSPVTAQRQTQSFQGSNKPQQTGPSTGQRVGNAALNAGLSYLAARYGGAGGQKSNPWVSAGLGALGGFF